MYISEFKVEHGVGVRSQTKLTLPDSVDKSLSWQVFYATKVVRPGTQKDVAHLHGWYGSSIPQNEPFAPKKVVTGALSAQTMKYLNRNRVFDAPVASTSPQLTQVRNRPQYVYQGRVLLLGYRPDRVRPVEVICVGTFTYSDAQVELTDSWVLMKFGEAKVDPTGVRYITGTRYNPVSGEVIGTVEYDYFGGGTLPLPGSFVVITKLLRPANGSSRQRSVRGDADMYAFWGREVSLWCSSEPTEVPSAQMLLYKFWGVTVPDSQK